MTWRAVRGVLSTSLPLLPALLATVRLKDAEHVGENPNGQEQAEREDCEHAPHPATEYLFLKERFSAAGLAFALDLFNGHAVTLLFHVCLLEYNVRQLVPRCQRGRLTFEQILLKHSYEEKVQRQEGSSSAKSAVQRRRQKSLPTRCGEGRLRRECLGLDSVPFTKAIA